MHSDPLKLEEEIHFDAFVNNRDNGLYHNNCQNEGHNTYQMWSCEALILRDSESILFICRACSHTSLIELSFCLSDLQHTFAYMCTFLDRTMGMGLLSLSSAVEKVGVLPWEACNADLLTGRAKERAVFRSRN